MKRWVLGGVLAVAIAGCKDDTTSATGTATDTDGSGDGRDDGDGVDAADDTAGDDADAPCTVDADCDDDNPCTDDTCQPDGSCTHAPIAEITNECRPTIDVTFPPRGATVSGAAGDPKVTVTGTVHSGVAPITALSINGTPVTVAADGSFSHPVAASTGGNLLVLETTDAADNKRRRVQSFLWSTAYDLPDGAGEGLAPAGVGLYLDQEAIDDGDRALPIDDIASLLQIVFDNFDVGALFDPNSPIVQQAGYDVYITDLTIGPKSVSLAGSDGGLAITAHIDDILGDLFFDCTTTACWFAGGDSDGGFSITTLQMNAQMVLTANADHQLEAHLASVDVVIDPDDVEIWSNNAWTNFLLSVIEVFIHDQMVQDFENTLEATIEEDFGPLLTEGLAQIALGLSFDFPNLGNAREPIVVDLALDFSKTDFHDGAAPPNPSPPQGGLIVMRGGGVPTQDVTPYVNLGVPRRNSCGTDVNDFDTLRTSPLEIALADDLLNQLLHAGWRGGLLEFPLSSEQLGGGGGGPVQDFHVEVSGMLAPTASDCAADGALRVTIGDVRIDAELTLLDEPVTFTAYTTLIAGLEVAQTDDGLAIGLGAVERVETELTANDEAIELEELLMAQLEMQLVDGLLGELGGLGNFTLPEVDLGSLLGLPPGEAVLTINVQQVTRRPGVSVIEAHL